MTTLAFFPNFSAWELLIIAGIALLIFGKRLPEVGRSLGKGIVEFKKGLKGIEEDVEQVDYDVDKPASRKALSHEEQSNFKFDPHTGQPINQPAAAPAHKFDPYTG